MSEVSVALEVLQYAMRNERLGHCFYLRAMEMTADDKGKKMFRAIASDEQQHLAILRRQLNSLKKTGNWVVLEKARGKRVASPRVLFPGEEAEVDKLIQKRASDLDALDIALDLERRGHELYRKEAEKAADLTARAVYQYLAKEEDKHFTLLQKARSYLASRGEWLWDDLQHPMLDG